MSTIPVVDKDNHFIGAFAMKDIAKKEILGDNSKLNSNYDHILQTIEGKEILRFADEISGELTNIAIRSTSFYNQDLFNKDTILIVGDRHSIIEEAVKKGVKLIVITTGHKMKEEHLEIAKKNKVNTA